MLVWEMNMVVELMESGGDQGFSFGMIIVVVECWCGCGVYMVVVLRVGG